MRIHLPALPGQPVRPDNSVCAFTQKVRRFAELVEANGHQAIVYGMADHHHAGRHVTCYPDTDPPPFTPEGWLPFNESAAEAIRDRLEPGDLICLIGGVAQQHLQTLPAQTVEFGIGYGGSIRNHPRCFESYAWQHASYAGESGSNDRADGGFFDCVIPASFDTSSDEFIFSEFKDDYLLFVGRLIERKGVHIAAETAKRLGLRLLIAGEGDFRPEYGEYTGKVGPLERAKLMSEATALLAPTTYLEPFGFVVVEAQLAGTPAITTDWGAFAETVEHGVSGFRARTLSEFCEAVELAPTLDPFEIRRYAERNFDYRAVWPKYEAWFEQVRTLTDQGWYAETSPGNYHARYQSLL